MLLTNDASQTQASNKIATANSKGVSFIDKLIYHSAPMIAVGTTAIQLARIRNLRSYNYKHLPLYFKM